MPRKAKSQLLTLHEVARELNCCYRTAQRYAQSGLLETDRRLGRGRGKPVRVYRASVERHLRKIAKQNKGA